MEGLDAVEATVATQRFEGHEGFGLAESTRSIVRGSTAFLIAIACGREGGSVVREP